MHDVSDRLIVEGGSVGAGGTTRFNLCFDAIGFKVRAFYDLTCYVKYAIART